jgi:multidrug efflux pump
MVKAVPWDPAKKPGPPSRRRPASADCRSPSQPTPRNRCLPSSSSTGPIFAWVIALIILLPAAWRCASCRWPATRQVAPPALSITLNYPGASAQVVEESVVALIEQEMNGIERLLYMESASEQGIGTVTLTFEAGTNLDLASVEAQNRIKRAEARLPEEVRRLGITVNKAARNYLLFISLFSPDNSLPTSTSAAMPRPTCWKTSAARRASARPSCSAPSTRCASGSSPKTACLRPDAGRRGQSGARAEHPARRRRTRPVAGGRRPANQRRDRHPFAARDARGVRRNHRRANAGGATVRVKDIARVELGAQDYSIAARTDQQPSAAIAVRMAPGANALDTAKAVKERMAELAKYFPKGISWEIPYDTSRFVDISIREVLKTLAEAMALVFLVMYVFLGNLRATFIPAIVVPVALVGGLVGLYLFGYSVNVLTLFAMVLAIGIVVDDAIVVVENVERIMSEENLPPREATRKAMDQIVGAIIAITLVLSAVFVPMAFFGGSTGAIYRQFAVTLVLTMGFSALLALSLTPALCATAAQAQARQR